MKKRKLGISGLEAADIELTPDDLREMEEAYSKITVHRTRLSAEHMALIDA
jgi:hypothetical protein